MKKLGLVARLVLGLLFFVFGLNGFLGFLPQPPLEEAGLKFIMALVETGYLLKLIKGIEVLAGVLLLANAFVPLALLLLSPIVVNIVLFHFLLSFAPGLPLVIVALMIIVALDRKENFKHVLVRK